jgi:uncharacterized protein YlxW (UPF0749 family)
MIILVMQDIETNTKKHLRGVKVTDFINNISMAKFVMLCISILVITVPTIFLFGGELLQIAKEKMRKKIDEKDSDSSKLEYIKELLETKNEALNERIERTEKSVERIERNIEGLVNKMDEGFRGVYSRLNDHIDRDQALLAKSYQGQERRGGAR